MVNYWAAVQVFHVIPIRSLAFQPSITGVLKSQAWRFPTLNGLVYENLSHKVTMCIFYHYVVCKVSLSLGLHIRLWQVFCLVSIPFGCSLISCLLDYSANNTYAPTWTFSWFIGAMNLSAFVFLLNIQNRCAEHVMGVRWARFIEPTQGLQGYGHQCSSGNFEWFPASLVPH